MGYSCFCSTFTCCFRTFDLLWQRDDGADLLVCHGGMALSVSSLLTYPLDVRWTYPFVQLSAGEAHRSGGEIDKRTGRRHRTDESFLYTQGYNGTASGISVGDCAPGIYNFRDCRCDAYVRERIMEDGKRLWESGSRM